MTESIEKLSTKIESINTGLSVQGIRTIFFIQNMNMVSAMEWFEDAFMLEYTNKKDMNGLIKKLNFYKPLNLKQQEIEKHGESLMQDILSATLVDSYCKSLVFFNNADNSLWFKKLQEYRKFIIKMDCPDPSLLLNILNDLYDSLHCLYLNFDDNHKKGYENLDETDEDIQFEFSFLYNDLSKIKDLITKKNFLVDAIAERDMLCLKLDKDPNNYYPNIVFKEQCIKTIAIIKNQIESIHIDSTINEKPKPDSESIQKYPEFTTKRQVLAMYYLLNEADKNTNSIDRTVRARFILFMTGKNESNIYDALSNPFKGLENEKNKKAALEDMKFVRSQFELLQMNAIVEKITKDMKID